MSEDRSRGREREPPGYYSRLSGSKGKSKMADSENGDVQKLKTVKSKKPKSRSSSKKGSSRAGSVQGLERDLRELEEEEAKVDEEIGEMVDRDAYSAALHRRAMQHEIEFVEDIEPPKNLENEEVWTEVNEQHEKEDRIIKERMVRLQRREELMQIKSKLREDRLRLVQEEHRLEMEEKARQMEVQAAWLRLQKEQFKISQEWQAQQQEYEDFMKLKSVDGWVANTVRQAGRQISLGGMQAETLQRPVTVEKAKNPMKPSAQCEEVEDRLLKEAQVLKSKVETSRMPAGVSHLERMGCCQRMG